MLRWPLTENSQSCWTPANISALWCSPRFRQKSDQLMQREARTSEEPLLPVSRRPSHWEMISQRNNGAPSRIPNRISPWWFTQQTVALLLCSWILTHTMPWRHLLIEIAPSQFIRGDQTDHMSHKLSEKLHKMGPCQKLLTTKSDLTQMTTKDLQRTWNIRQTMSFVLCLESCVNTVTYNSSAFLGYISSALRGVNLVLMLKKL